MVKMVSHGKHIAIIIQQLDKFNPVIQSMEDFLNESAKLLKVYDPRNIVAQFPGLATDQPAIINRPMQKLPPVCILINAIPLNHSQDSSLCVLC